ALLGEDLIVSVDQEGGKVERLRKVASSLPSMQALGQASLLPDKIDFDPQLIIDYSTTLASSLHELGFNMVFAPCVDLATNPLNPIIGTRSLGSNEDLVSRQAKLIIKTLQEANIITCAKHFPGHGDTSKDS
ncbi:MAG: glycoside hydrolase family 3 N-terminal domain-containing protein, partial [bacterium]